MHSDNAVKPTFYFDTETFLIAPSIQAPPMVCFQYCVDQERPRISHARIAKDIVHYALSEARLVGHNVAFDMSVICAQWPEFTPLVFLAYDQNRVTCTETRQKLIDIGKGRIRGEKKLAYDLGTCSERAGGPTLDKSDPWRLRYGQLYNTPTSSWPPEALQYALKDAEATRAVYQAQETFAEFLEDQYRQARAAFWIQLMSCWGFRTNPDKAREYITYVQRTLEADKKLCVELGLVRPDGTKNTKLAQEWMLRICNEAGEECPLTDGGAPSLSEESVEEHGDYVLEAYQRYANASTRTKRATRLLNSPIQSRFNVLVNTGRTSCSQGDGKKSKATALQAPSAWGAQIQNVSKDKGFRDVFCAREGYALVSIDYDSLELRSWSQVFIWLFGSCKMADSINAGGDQHTELAARLLNISKEEAYRLKKTDKSFKDGPRFFAKAGNFGFLGGMGGAKFCKSLVKQAVHQGDPSIIAKAKAYTEDEAKKLKRAFCAEWDAQKYFDHWGDQLQDKDATISVKHWGSGRIRGGCWYTQACNSPFQGLAADLAKDAMWRVSREMYTDKSSPLYGSRIVNFVHDELIAEIPLPRLHEAAYRARDIMCDTGREWCPDLVFTAEPAAQLKWSKDAATVFDSSGKLVPWEG